MRFLPLALLLVAPSWAADATAVLGHIRSNDTAWLESNLKSKEDVNLRDSRQNTPLLWAAALGSPASVQLLLRQGADPNAANALGVTPLMAAAPDPVKVKLLLAAGADPKAKTKLGHHALVIAAAVPFAEESVRALLAAGAPVNEPGIRGITPLLAAAGGFCPDSLIKVLLDAGADPKASDAAGSSIAQVAGYCSPELRTRLLTAGLEIDKANTFGGKVRFGDIQLVGLTGLLLTSAHGNAAAVNDFLTRGANLGHKDIRGMNALHFAVSSETQDPAVVKLLLAKGVDPRAKDIHGQDALAWARKFNNPAVLAALGAKSEPAPLLRPTSQGPGVQVGLARLEDAAESFFKQSGCPACHATNLTSFAASRAALAGFKVNPTHLETRRQRIRGWLSGGSPLYLQMLGPGGDFDNLLYLLLEAKSLGLEASPEIELTARYVLHRQSLDGSWSSYGIARSPMEENNLHRTALSLWLLPATAPASMQPLLKERLALAVRWLAAQPARTADELGMKLLGLKWGGAPAAQITAAAKQLEAAQRKDGSWGGNAYLEGDAYSTGLALFALREGAQRPVNAKSVRSAVNWLLGTQAPDGTWHVKSRAPKFQPYFESGFPYGHDQWISASGSAWALAALSEAGVK